MAAGAVTLRTVNVLEEPEIRANLPRFSNLPTFPQLFINGELIGGCDIVLELFEAGELKRIVEEATRDECLAIDVTDQRGARWPPVAGSRGAGCRRRRWAGQCGGRCRRRRRGHRGPAGPQAAPPGPCLCQVQAVGPEPLLYPLDLEARAPTTMPNWPGPAARAGAPGWSAGLCRPFPGLTPFELADPASFARAVHVTLTAPAWLAQACLPLLRQREDAALVFAVDASERVGQAYWGGYGVAQHGLRGLITSLHDELCRSPVRVSGLYPGPLRTALRARAYSVDQDPAARGRRPPLRRP